VDKFLIDRKVHKPIILTIFIRTASIIPLICIIPFVGFSLPNTEFIGWILLASVFAVAGVLVYYKAIQMDEVSRVIPLFQFIPIFVLFLSFFLIREVLGIFDYLGFAVLVLGGLVISTKRLSGLLRVQKVFWVALLSSFFNALAYVIMKHVLNNVEYWSAFILLWSLQSLIILSLLASERARREAKFYIMMINRKDKIVIFIISIASILAFIFNYFAISLGPVTLVEAAANIQLVFTFLIALLLTKFFPYMLMERFDRKITLQKITGIVLIIIGVLLTQIF
jgi:drug/metabolite transporter (DMT)-like permease